MHPPERLSDIPPSRAAPMEAARRRALDYLAEKRYQLVVPPLAEHWETLTVGGGDLSARTFKMTDTMSGRTLGIRADHTPQIARFDAASGASGVRRWAYCGPTLRTRPDLPWRARETMQLGAELFGLDSPAGDFEIAETAAGTLKAAGVADLRADFGHAGIFKLLTDGADEDFRDRAWTAWSRRDAAALAELSAEGGVPGAALMPELAEMSGPEAETIRRARAFLENNRRVDRRTLGEMLDELQNCVRQMTAAGWDAEIDLSELGGYSYHSGIVFAFYGADYLAARGGRYEVPPLGRMESPKSAAGFSMDLREIAEREAEDN